MQNQLQEFPEQAEKGKTPAQGGFGMSGTGGHSWITMEIYSRKWTQIEAVVEHYAGAVRNTTSERNSFSGSRLEDAFYRFERW